MDISVCFCPAPLTKKPRIWIGGLWGKEGMKGMFERLGRQAGRQVTRAIRKGRWSVNRFTNIVIIQWTRENICEAAGS